ncbi:glycosyltransferase involved in cell wall biosynthesis [Neobacillus niacini]|uniref:glycosyltransferase n=1 Tax=Neobacillus niacini TaxID=86668 RepID=UPI00277E36DB|nr:glycosyltransferase [Neobacillus niacini]MDQ1000336.1 glycosyltransferase involved in cell wall biosynthesis [Neobacillus niacini]
MKKKILFVTYDLGVDGASKSLINILEQIDYDRYDVDLFLCLQRGMFMKFIPEKVNVLPTIKILSALTMPIKSSLISLLKQKHFTLFFPRLRYPINYKFKMSLANAAQQVWSAFSEYVPPIENRYDAVISYQDHWIKYFMAEKTKSNVKIAWNHCNLSKTEININVESKYISLIDHWVTISDECRHVLESMFPDSKQKIKVIENIISPSVIRHMAHQVNAFSDDNFKGKRIVTLGRLAHEKGIDIAIKACNLVVKAGYDIRWYVIGDGPQREEIEKLIKKYNLEDRFILLGINSNPYPYVAAADIYVQPSRTEGKSIAIEEAKALSKPIIVTNYQTVYDQIKHKKTGVIVPISEDGIAKGIKEVLNKPELTKEISKNLSYYSGNENEVNKLYELIGG